MFEAVFILTTLDAGTRVARFMLQDVLGGFYKPLGRTSWYPSIFVTSLLVVISWGYFLYGGVIDPHGGVNILWPLFGIANQILASIALCLATIMIIKSGKIKYCFVTLIPLAWLVSVVSTASYQKLFSDNVRIGLLAGARDLKEKFAAGLLDPEKAAVIDKLIFNQYLVAFLTAFFAILLIIVICDMLFFLNKKHMPSFRQIISFLNGNAEYKKYVKHLKEHHPKQKPLSKKEFFAKKEQEKWEGINSCC
jgi:carbon starvation protein